jgi:hypothetical protein
LNQFEDAYQHLQDLLANGGFPDPVLGPKDPGLDLFKPDSKFQDMMAQLNRQNEAIRARILEIDQGGKDRSSGVAGVQELQNR